MTAGKMLTTINYLIEPHLTNILSSPLMLFTINILCCNCSLDSVCMWTVFPTKRQIYSGQN